MISILTSNASLCPSLSLFRSKGLDLFRWNQTNLQANFTAQNLQAALSDNVSWHAIIDEGNTVSQLHADSAKKYCYLQSLENHC